MVVHVIPALGLTLLLPAIPLAILLSETLNAILCALSKGASFFSAACYTLSARHILIGSFKSSVLLPCHLICLTNDSSLHK